MSHRKLTVEELAQMANPLLKQVREMLDAYGDGDADLLWALRRKLAKELIYDERGKPVLRVALKKRKRQEQGALCAVCAQVLPAKGSVLDRIEVMAGYTLENTRLLCPSCDTAIQQERGYA
jgi:hypothetical protein